MDANPIFLPTAARSPLLSTTTPSPTGWPLPSLSNRIHFPKLAPVETTRHDPNGVSATRQLDRREEHGPLMGVGEPPLRLRLFHFHVFIFSQNFGVHLSWGEFMGCQWEVHGMSIRMRISDLERDLEICSLGFNLRIEYADIIDIEVHCRISTL